MRSKTVLLVLIAIMILFTACKTQTIPEYQIVIETIPDHLHDVIDIMQTRSGVYIFDANNFGTGKDTYLLISHGNKDNVMVDIDSMELNRYKELEIQLRETSASMPRAYTMIKLIDFSKQILIKNLDGKWPVINTDELSFTSRGNIVKLKNNDLQVEIADSVVVMEIVMPLSEKIASSSQDLFKAGDEVVVEYNLNGPTIQATEMLSVADSGTVEGVFVGYIDSKSVEIKVNDKAQTYWLSPETSQWLETNNIKTNSPVKFDYYVVDGDAAYVTKFHGE